jgi:hypothetical protein
MISSRRSTLSLLQVVASPELLRVAGVGDRVTVVEWLGPVAFLVISVGSFPQFVRTALYFAFSLGSSVTCTPPTGMKAARPFWAFPLLKKKSISFTSSQTNPSHRP